jgi:hypothetical protein
MLGNTPILEVGKMALVIANDVSANLESRLSFRTNPGVCCSQQGARKFGARGGLRRARFTQASCI